MIFIKKLLILTMITLMLITFRPVAMAITMQELAAKDSDSWQAYISISHDSLLRIAALYDLDIDLLVQVNNLQADQILAAGNLLWLPMPAIAGRQFIWPTVGIISSPFGPRDGGWHYGLDIAAALGDDIVAAKAGQVILAGWKSDAYGYTVMIDHGNNQHSLYAHCSGLWVTAGQKVEQGDIIAAIGSTGNSTGPHIHFEIRENGICKDPLNYL